MAGTHACRPALHGHGGAVQRSDVWVGHPGIRNWRYAYAVTLSTTAETTNPVVGAKKNSTRVFPAGLGPFLPAAVSLTGTQ